MTEPIIGTWDMYKIKTTADTHSLKMVCCIRMACEDISYETKYLPNNVINWLQNKWFDILRKNREKYLIDDDADDYYHHNYSSDPGYLWRYLWGGSMPVL